MQQLQICWTKLNHYIINIKTVIITYTWQNLITKTFKLITPHKIIKCQLKKTIHE